MKVIDTADVLDINLSCLGLVGIVFTFTVRTLMNSGSLLEVVDAVGRRSANGFMMINDR